jgi:hypothetical protein
VSSAESTWGRVPFNDLPITLLKFMFIRVHSWFSVSRRVNGYKGVEFEEIRLQNLPASARALALPHCWQILRLVPRLGDDIFRVLRCHEFRKGKRIPTGQEARLSSGTNAG